MKAIQKYEFTELRNAMSFAGHCLKLHMIVLGDNGKFWVMLPKFSEYLVRNGYEYAIY